MPQPLIIVGASTRAAAHSACRAGFAPWCVDLFADEDLRAVADVCDITPERYPQGLVQLVRTKAPSAPLIYTGGLENHPNVHGELAKIRTVWGYLHPPLDPGIRDPRFLDECCRQAGLARPASVFVGHGLPTDGSWLCKPMAGAGGHGIQVWRGQTLTNPKGYYWQQRLPGHSLSASFVGLEEETVCLGITRQLIGESFLHAPSPFTYCGNFGPLPKYGNEQLWNVCERMGKVFTAADPHLRGLFGVDFLWWQETAFALEVNPRYTASMELLEWSDAELRVLQLHAQAFCGSKPSGAMAPRNSKGSWFGKGVYYAQHDVKFPPNGPWQSVTGAASTGLLAPPVFADIPQAGSFIKKNQPVMTLVTTGQSEEEAKARLRRRGAELDELLRPHFMAN